MIITYPNKEWNWGFISINPGITTQNIINHPEYPWSWESHSGKLNLSMNDISPNHPWNWGRVFRNEFKSDKDLYVNNQLGRILLVSMLDDYNNDTSTLLDQTLLLLYNDYHLSCILPYI